MIFKMIINCHVLTLNYVFLYIQSTNNPLSLIENGSLKDDFFNALIQ